MSALAAALPAGPVFGDDLLPTLLEISLSAVGLLNPCYGPNEAGPVDFTVDYLNPAGQRLLNLPERPVGTLRTHFACPQLAGLLAYCCQALETSEAGPYETSCQLRGLATRLHLVAQRYGQRLVVSFSATIDPDHGTEKQPRRASQRRELAARTEVEQLFQRVPAAICVFEGPELVYELVNPGYQELFRGRELLGKPLLEALPELTGYPVWDTLQRVYQTGELFIDVNVLVPLVRQGSVPQVDSYFTILLLARHDARGRINGVLLFALDVTNQVQTQQRADSLQAELLASAQLLSQERERLYQILQHTPAAISLHRGPEHRFDYCNAACEQTLLDRRMLGRPLVEVVPEAIATGIVALLDEVYRTGQTYFGYEQAVHLEQPDNSPPPDLYFNFTLQAYREGGRIVGTSIFAYDVTAQVLASRQQQSQQRQVQELFEQAPVAIAVLRGPRYVVELANPVVCALWGRTPAQALGAPLFELLPEAAGQGFEELLDGVLTTGVPHVAHELPSFINRQGRRDQVYWNFVYQPLREADGAIRGIIVVATEVSELLRARQRLAAQRQLQDVFEQAPMAIGVFSGPAYLVDVCNPGLQAIWGRTAAEALHRPLFEVLPEVRDQGFKELLDEVVRTGVPYVAREVPLQLAPHGQPVTRHINFVYHPLRDAHGRVTAIAAVATDVSEQVTARQLVQQQNNRQVAGLNQELAVANEKLRTNNAELEQKIADRTQALVSTLEQLERRSHELTLALAAEQELGELKSSFVSLASHEFRTPLTVVLSSAALIEKYSGSDQQAQRQKHLERIRLSVNHLNGILEEFLSVGRIEEGNLEAHPVALNVTPLLTETLTDVQSTLKDEQTIDWQVHCPTPVLLDPALLRTVLLNLLSNAIKYSGAGSVVTVLAECDSRQFTLRVQDQGVGISEEDQQHLFERFFRARSITAISGTGLGLYIVAKSVELMGGTIVLHSELDRGTLFTVTVPL